MKYGTHTTYCNDKNEEVPSVTTIIKILNKPSLAKWANIMGFRGQKIEDLLEKSSNIGTQVHKIIESYLMNRYYIFISTHDVSKFTIMSYLNSFLEWKKAHEVSPIFMERKLSTEKFGGTVDFYGIVDNKKTILDFKTSKKVYSTMFLQLGAYCIMLEEKGYEVDQAAIIIVNKDGYNEKFISRKDLQRYMDIFKILVELFHAWYNINISDGWGDILEK